MSFKRYTECVDPSDYHDLSSHRTYGRAFLILILTLVVMVGVGSIILGGTATIVIISTTLALVIGGIVYARWDLFVRLICLDQDPKDCAIVGKVESTEKVDAIGKKGDNDYCINVLLAPGPNSGEGQKIEEVDKEEFWESAPQGHLLAENLRVKNEAGMGYVQDGGSLNYMKVLHCEFEGDGVRSILDSLYAMAIFLGIALAIAIAALYFPPLIVLAWILFIFAVLLGISTLQNLSRSLPPFIEDGNPLNVDPTNGPITPGWFVVVKGVWVYDSNHQGWNEIHPILDFQIIWKPLIEGASFKDFKYTDTNTNTVYDLDTVENVERYRIIWCDMLRDAKDSEDNGSRVDPNNDWGIHPIVDGCKPPDIIL